MENFKRLYANIQAPITTSQQRHNHHCNGRPSPDGTRWHRCGARFREELD